MLPLFAVAAIVAIIGAEGLFTVDEVYLDAVARDRSARPKGSKREGQHGAVVEELPEAPAGVARREREPYRGRQ